jgi:hypothetical protein
MCEVDYSVGPNSTASFDLLFMMQTFTKLSPREYDQMSHRVRQFGQRECHTYIPRPHSDVSNPITPEGLRASLERKQHKVTEAEREYTRQKMFLVPGAATFRWGPEEEWLFLCYMYCTLEHNIAQARFLEAFVQLCHRQAYTFKFVDFTWTSTQRAAKDRQLKEQAEQAIKGMLPEEKDAHERASLLSEEAKSTRDGIETEVKGKSIEEIDAYLASLPVKRIASREDDRARLYKHKARYPDEDIVPHTFEAMEKILRSRKKIYRTAIIERHGGIKRAREHDTHRENAKRRELKLEERDSYMPLLESERMVHILVQSIEHVCACLGVQRTEGVGLASTLINARVKRTDFQVRLPAITRLINDRLVDVHQIRMRGGTLRASKQGVDYHTKQAVQILSSFTNKEIGWEFKKIARKNDSSQEEYGFIPTKCLGSNTLIVALSSTYAKSRTTGQTEHQYEDTTDDAPPSIPNQNPLSLNDGYCNREQIRSQNSIRRRNGMDIQLLQLKLSEYNFTLRRCKKQMPHTA